MKITIDDNAKTIEFESGINLQTLVDYLKDHNINLEDYSLIYKDVVRVIEVKGLPQIQKEIIVQPYVAPFPTNPWNPTIIY